MLRQIAAGETEPLLTDVPRYDVSNSSDISSAHLDRVDSCVPEVTCTQVSDDQIQVFKRRWYILILYSLVNLMQSMIWNTWGPLALSAQIAFGWSLDEIALLTNWGCIMYALSTFFFSWLMDVKGTTYYFFDCDVFLDYWKYFILLWIVYDQLCLFLQVETFGWS